LEQRIADYHEGGRRTVVLRELLEVLLRVAEGLAHAHSRHVLHRDLKPANIMVGRYGEVLIIDWGIASILGEQDDLFLLSKKIDEAESQKLTEEGAIIGTPGYMAPEQVKGSELTMRVDVYALGAILTKVLTDELPVKG